MAVRSVQEKKKGEATVSDTLPFKAEAHKGAELEELHPFKGLCTIASIIALTFSQKAATVNVGSVTVKLCC
jgi:hypothetical protein